VADLVDGLRESVTTADGLSLIAQDAGEVIGQ
jgi:predicted N-acetyltransferase YhbS